MFIIACLLSFADFQSHWHWMSHLPKTISSDPTLVGEKLYAQLFFVQLLLADRYIPHSDIRRFCSHFPIFAQVFVNYAKNVEIFLWIF